MEFQISEGKKNHAKQELADSKDEIEKTSGQKKIEIDSKKDSLDALSIKILTMLGIADSKGQKIGVIGMRQLLGDLGEDDFIANLTLDKLRKEGYIGSTLNTYGDSRCNYYLGNSGKEFLRTNADIVIQVRQQVPATYSPYENVRGGIY